MVASVLRPGAGCQVICRYTPVQVLIRCKGEDKEIVPLKNLHKETLERSFGSQVLKPAGALKLT